MAQHMQSILLGVAEEDAVMSLQPHYQDAGILRCILIEAESGPEQGTDWCARVEAWVGKPFPGQILKPFTGDKNAVLLMLTDLMVNREAVTLEQYLTRLHADLSHGQEAAIACYVGKEVHELEALHESYQSCGIMKSLRFFTTCRPIYYFELMDTTLFVNRPGQFEKQLFDGLVKSIEEQQTDELHSHAKAIFQFFWMSESSLVLSASTCIIWHTLCWIS